MLINEPIRIIEVICLHFDLTPFELKQKRRFRRIAYPRQIAMYFLRKKCLLTYMEIARLIGVKDHTTVYHAVQTAEGFYQVDYGIREEIDLIGKKIEESALKISPYVFAGIEF